MIDKTLFNELAADPQGTLTHSGRMPFSGLECLSVVKYSSLSVCLANTQKAELKKI